MICLLYGSQKGKKSTFLRYITIFGYPIEHTSASMEFKKSPWSHVCVRRICSMHRETTTFVSEDRHDDLQAFKHSYHVT